MAIAHYNDVGTIIRVIVRENGNVKNISSASTLQIILTDPTFDKKTKTASFTTDGTDGAIEYTTVDGDFDEVGVWEVQGIVDGFKSEIETFEVRRNL